MRRIEIVEDCGWEKEHLCPSLDRRVLSPDAIPSVAIEAAAREWLRRQGVLWEDHSVIDIEDAEAALAAALEAMKGTP